MEKKPDFQTMLRESADGQFMLPLPKPKGIKADMCRYCHGVHMNVTAFLNCREANT